MNTKIFLVFVALNILLALFFGFLPLVNFPFTLELNQIPYSDKLIVFGVVSGTAILFLAGVLILSFIWTRARKWEGAVIGILAGVYLFVVGILAWIYTGNPGAFYVDSFRGLFTIVFGYLSYSSLASKRT